MTMVSHDQATHKELPQTFTGPALVDLQVNGYAGFSFNSPPDQWTAEALHDLRRRINARGVGVCLPTLITSDIEAIVSRARRFAELTASDSELAATFPKLHIEGPFISPEEGPIGAHPPEFVAIPAEHPDLIDRIQEASGGRVAIVTLAPELDGAPELIKRCTDAGICVAIGHTRTNAQQLAAAIDAGAKMSTHLGNGSHQRLARLDNYLQRQLAADELAASFIADGHHMPFTTLKNFIRAKTIRRSILVTDAMEAAEMPSGEHKLAGMTVIVTPQGRVSRPGQDNLAGSTLTLDMAVINTFLHCGVTFNEAWQMASTQAAEMIGLEITERVTVQISPGGFERV